MQLNIVKLKARYPEGFDESKSLKEDGQQTILQTRGQVYDLPSLQEGSQDGYRT